jgi:hypothetical protein
MSSIQCADYDEVDVRVFEDNVERDGSGGRECETPGSPTQALAPC